MEVGPIADLLSEAERLAWATTPTKNSTTILGMAPAIGSWVAAKGLHGAPTPPDRGDHAQLLSLRLSMHSTCRFLIHSVVGDHVLRDHQDEQKSIQCELHLRVAQCRLDCMIASFVQKSPWVILEVFKFEGREFTSHFCLCATVSGCVLSHQLLLMVPEHFLFLRGAPELKLFRMST